MPQGILIVEDNEPVRKMFSKFVSQNGYKVAEASNGREAMEQIEHMPAELVITDTIMPGMDGMEINVALRRIYPGVKIIALSESGLGPAENCPKIARALGAHKYW